MSLTRIDCQIFRGAGSSSDTSSFVAINPREAAGSLVLAGSVAVKESLGSQVACKLGLEHFLSGVLDYYQSSKLRKKPSINGSDSLNQSEGSADISLEVLESAFKNANSSVYNFGHKLAAGGRMSASLLGLVLEEKMIAAGKVGPGSVYLYRAGELFPFFERTRKDRSGKLLESYLGAQSVVSVELASVPAEESDILVVLPEELNDQEEGELPHLIRAMLGNSANSAGYICKHLFGDVYKIPFAFVAKIGPETIYLAQAV